MRKRGLADIPRDAAVLTGSLRPFAPDEPSTLIDVFTRVARVHKRTDTLNYKRDGRWVPMSSDELLSRVKDIAAGLHAIGIRHGDRVALLSDSRVEWTLTDARLPFLRARSTFRSIRR